MAFGFGKKEPNSGHPFREPQTPTQGIDPRVKAAIGEGEEIFKREQQKGIDNLKKSAEDPNNEGSVFAHIRHNSSLGNRKAIVNAPNVPGWSGWEANEYAANLLRKISGLTVEMTNGGYIEVSW